MKKTLLLVFTLLFAVSAWAQTVPVTDALIVHLDADGLSAGDLETWHDQSGNDNHATQVNVENRPTVILDALNGLPVVRFDGDHFLSTGFGSFTADQPNTIFVVAKSNNLDTGDEPFIAGTAVNSCNNILLRDGDYRIYAGGTGATDGAATTDFALLTGLFNNPGDGSSLWVNGIQELTDEDVGDEGLEGINIGANEHVAGGGTGTQTFLDGDIAEILVYDAALSDADREAVELYLMQKWFPVQVFDGATFKTGLPTIQAAIDAADPDDIVKIRGGTYVEDVDDYKGVTFSPGTSPDCVTISGNFTVTPATTFDMDIWGENVCDDYDQIEVTGDLTITNSTLNILLDGYVPNLGDEFVIFTYGTLTGEFDDILVDNPDVEFTISYGDLSTASEIVLTTSNVPPAIPLVNWALYLGILLMITFVVFRFKRMI